MPVDRPVPYEVEVCERVPVVRRVQVPIHVPVKVPVAQPVYVKEYVPQYKQKIIPVERKVYKQITRVIEVPKPVICTEYKKVQVEVPIIKREIVPIIKTCIIKKPVPIFETRVTQTQIQQSAGCAPVQESSPCNFEAQ